MIRISLRRAGCVAMTSAALVVAGAAPASAADREYTLAAGGSAAWTGTNTGAYVLYPVLGCSGERTPVNQCDATHITIDGPASTLALTMDGGDTDDFDLFVYQDNDKDGVPDGDAFDGNYGNFVGEDEDVFVPNPAGTYLVEVSSFLTVSGTFNATATVVE